MANGNGRSPEQWATRIGVILAVAGSAVGLGNFLRFPGQAAQNGGGTFMIPYFIALLVLGIPLCWAEWTMGRYGGTRGFNSAPGIYSTIWRNRFAKYGGVLSLLIPLVIYMYYVVIEAWCLGYAINYLVGNEKLMSSDPNEVTGFFDHFVGTAEDGVLLSVGGNRIFLWILLGTFVMNFFFIYRGVTKGIETFCRYAMPCMLILGLIVLVRVLTLGTPNPDLPKQSVLGGLAFMWEPQWEELWDSQTWLAAAGQVFFSLSVGFGIVVNYASYLRRNDDVVLSGLTASSVNEFFEVCIAGLITIPAGFIFLGATVGDQGTFGLGFNTLPNVFAQMTGGRIFGFLWFFMLFIAAITSSLSMLQPVIAFLEEGFDLKRHASAAILGLLAALGALFVVYFSKGLVALDTLDFWVGTVLIVLLALFQSLLYGWGLGIRRGEAEAHRGAHIRIPRFVQYNLKFGVPVFLGAIFVMVCIQGVPSKLEPVMIADETESEAVRPAKIQLVVPASLAEIEQPAAPPAALVEQLAAHELEVPEGAMIRTVGDDTWQIDSAEGGRLYVFARHEDGLSVAQHDAGYYEDVVTSPVALMSVIFVAVLIVFLTLLIHLAGKRWEREGRYNYHDVADEETP